MGLALILAVGVLSAPLLAQVPRQDSRNADIPNTNTHFKMPSYGSLAEWQAKRSRLGRQILSAAGLFPLLPRTPLRPMISGRLDRGDYSIEKVLIETMPGYWLGGNLYRPARRSGRAPGVLIPHGHWKRGRLEDLPSYSVPALGANLARQGYVAFAYDMAGYNDTRQTSHDFGGEAEQLWSFNPLGLQLWNSIRALDFLQSLPDVNGSRIGVTGASGGGTQTFLLAAVDSRVRAAAPVNMISAFMQGGDPCEDAPNLRLGAFNVEFAAMMAPRPMLMVSASGDWTRNTPREEYPEVRRIYQLYGREDAVSNAHFDAPHNYNAASREAVYQFFARTLLRTGDTSAFRDLPVKPEKDEDMLALSGRDLPSGASATYEAVFQAWRSAVSAQAANAGRESLGERLAAAIGVEWPEHVWSEHDIEQVVLSRLAKQDRVPGVWIPGTGRDSAVLVHPGGSAKARATPAARELFEQGVNVLAIDAFQTGAAIAPRDRSHKYFLTYNQTDDTNRVQDILTALAYLDQRMRGPIRLVCLNGSGLWCLFAAAVAGNRAQLQADLNGFRGTDKEFIGKFFVPGIQRGGGLEAALRLARLAPLPSASRTPGPLQYNPRHGAFLLRAPGGPVPGSGGGAF